jgi:hypothetical protein
MIFIIGLNKTGTTSIKKALTIGGNTKSYGVDQYKLIQHLDSFEYIYNMVKLNVYKGITIFKDRPWNMDLYKKLDKSFPEAKFILTIRDQETWWGSVLNNLEEKSNKPIIDTYKMHFKCQEINKEKFIEYYINYNLKAEEYFNNKKNFFKLEMPKDFNWKNIMKILNISEDLLKTRILEYQSLNPKVKYITEENKNDIEKWKFVIANVRKKNI